MKENIDDMNEKEFCIYRLKESIKECKEYIKNSRDCIKIDKKMLRKCKKELFLYWIHKRY